MASKLFDNNAKGQMRIRLVVGVLYSPFHPGQCSYLSIVRDLRGES